MLPAATFLDSAYATVTLHFINDETSRKKESKQIPAHFGLSLLLLSDAINFSEFNSITIKGQTFHAPLFPFFFGTPKNCTAFSEFGSGSSELMNSKPNVNFPSFLFP